MSRVVTILRVIEYTGPVEDVNRCIAERRVKGVYRPAMMGLGVTIREGLLGEVPRPIQGDEVNHYLRFDIPVKELDTDE